MERYEFSNESRELLEKSVIPFAIYQFIDKRVVTLIVSDGFCKLFHYERKEEAYYDMDHNMYAASYPDDVARIAEAAYRFATEGGKYDVVYRTKKKGGDTYNIIHSIGEHFETKEGIRLAQVWYTDEGEYSEEDLKDTFEKVVKVDRKPVNGLYDHLTGLPTMTCFLEIAEAGCLRMIQEGKVPAILFFDLCGMKNFNHQYGFVEGDKVLKSFADLLARIFGESNSSRFVQDHFVAFLDEDNIVEMTHALFDEWKKCCYRKALPIRVGVYLIDTKDINIITACDNAKVASDLIRNSYVSKINYFDKSLQEDIDKRDYIISNIDKAISEKWIQIYYQPIVRAVNGSVCDEEALARWIDPEKGFMSPADFISVLEEASLIYKLDLYVVDEIIEKIKIFEKEGLHIVPQSVNLSRSDFEECDIVEEICKKMDAAGIDHSLLTIEITESIIGSNFEYMKTQVERFRSLGFQVWMDDFGSGYSSLDVLQDLTFDLIKFDMRFLTQLENGENGKIILSELMRMATSLGLETVCEGVETKEHVEFLGDIGCCKLQGYYYTKPLPLSEILDRYKTGRQIGFENPDEAEYYDTLGKINLYDLDWVMSDDSVDTEKVYTSVPMVIMELNDEAVRIVRSNATYREFSDRALERNIGKEFEKFDTIPMHHQKSFLSPMIQCAKNGTYMLVDEKFPDNTTVHTIMRRVAVNSVQNTQSVAVAVLSITDDTPGTTYANIANSLAADYFELFYVNLNSEEYILYCSDMSKGEFSERMRGKKFFSDGRKLALKLLYKSDRASFMEEFTKEKILQGLDESGRYTLTYRIVQKGKPVHIGIKVMRMSNDEHHIIVALSNINSEMKQREALEKIKREQIASSRLSALASDYICMYTVNPEDDSYFEFGLRCKSESLGLAKEGRHFFERCLEEAKHIILEEDYPEFAKNFDKSKVLKSIKKNGLYTISYRIRLDGNICKGNLKAASVSEPDGEKLVFGLYVSDPIE